MASRQGTDLNEIRGQWQVPGQRVCSPKKLVITPGLAVRLEQGMAQFNPEQLAAILALLRCCDVSIEDSEHGDDIF